MLYVDAFRGLAAHIRPRLICKRVFQWAGVQLIPEKIAATQNFRTSALISHMVSRDLSYAGYLLTGCLQGLLEEQLSDGREWLMDTETPGLADISLHFIFTFVRSFLPDSDIFDPKAFPKALAVSDATFQETARAQPV